MSVSKLIAELSPEQRELLARQLREKKTKPNQMTIVPRNESSAPLSFHQERLWFLIQYEPDRPLYNLPAGVRLTGPLNRTALEQSVNAIIARHEAIRTSFALKNGEMVQVVNPPRPIELPLTDLSALAGDEQEREVQRLIEVEARAPFDLATGRLVRVSLLRLQEEKHIALFTMHHIISDGWSIGVFTRELAAFYEAFVKGEHPSLPALPIQYGDFANWQREWLSGDVLEQELFYWKQQLSGISPMLQLPTDRQRPATQTFNGAKHSFAFPAQLSTDLTAFCQQEQVTTFMFLVAALQALLHRYSGQDDIIIGTPVAGRYPLETETLIGYFVNTLALRSIVTGEMTFRQLLKNVRETSMEAFAHQNVPFEKLVDAVAPARDLSHTPLIQVWFVLHNTPMPRLNLRGLELEPFEVDAGTAKFDLTLSTVQTPQGLRGSWVYNTDLFNVETVARISEQFQRLLEGAVRNPDRSISSLPLLSQQEREQLTAACHAPAAGRPLNLCLHQLFEAQVERTPDALAVEIGAERVTYQQLNQRANQLAHYLRALGIGPEKLVGICMERSLDVIVGLLATLKAGGVYVPLDPQQPEERLAFMMKDAEAPVLLTQSWLVAELPAYAAMSTVVCLDDDWQTIEQESETNLTNEIAPESLAYIIYTSGSTGKPKGVCISHRVAVDHCLTMQQAFGLSDADRVLQFASFNFDVSLEQILPTLFTGATLVLRGNELWTVSDFQHQLEKLNLTVANLPTAYWHQLAKEESLSSGRLRLMIVGGDLLLPEPAKLWQSRSQSTILINAYGPTETAITASLFVIPPGFCDESMSGRVPIGRPLTNRSMFVLDRDLELTPTGVPGELYIGGPLLARGYFNRPDLTAERFCPNPFSQTNGERLYRTGDIVRYLPDGNVEFLGRVDDQVKIRGYRIELGEIEAALVENPDVREAVVMPREDVPGEKRLVAYVVSEQGKSQKPSELRFFLKKKLPEYMVPSAFVMLSELPLTPNGKVDRVVLPAPDDSRPEVEASFVAPGTVVEETLAHIWSDVLGLERVGINDDFFELGGHSLLATQVVSRVREAFGIDLPLRRLFESPTIAALAEIVESELKTGTEAAKISIQARERDGSLPLSFAQQRLWYLNQLDSGSAVYNMLTMVEFEGELNVEILERCFHEVIKRHEVLRTTFAAVDGEPQQVISSPGRTTPLSTRNLAQLPETKQQELIAKFAREESARRFNLEKGPLLRALLVVLGDKRHVLLLTLHHIVSDGWSLGLFVKEVAALYTAFAKNEPSPLSELSIQYGDYALWEKELLQGEKLQNDYRYWEQQLAALPEELNLPIDYPRPAARSFRGRNTTFTVSEQLLAKLKELSRSEGATLFMTLLAAWQVLLARYSGQLDIAVGSPVAGRNQRELEQLIGFFVNTLVLRTDLSGEPSFREVLQRVRDVSLNAYMHQQLPFEKLVEALQPERQTNRNPLFQVMFSLQNTPEPELEFAGLKLRPLEFHSGTAKFDLTMDLAEAPEGLKGWLEYSSDLFEAATIERMATHFQVLLAAIVAHPEESILKLPLLKPEERQLVLVEWNQTEQTYPSALCVHELFEAQVERTPEQTAVVYEQQRLTYRELNERANQLAHHLRSLGAGPESLVGVCLERSAQMMVALLGILKSGAAYLPLDPDYPQERLSYMLADSHAGVLLTTGSLGARFTELPLTVVSLDDDRDQIAARATSNVASGVTPANLAYVMYTSGSTGRPKGIMVPHEGVVNFFTGMKQSIGDEESGTWLAETSISFDISVLELLGSLARGFEVVVQPDLARTLNTTSPRRKFATKKMDFSLFYFASDESEANQDKYQLLIEGAKFADQNGFDAVWTPERHFHQFGGLYPNPSITSAVVAAITERVNIRAGSVVLPLHTPVRVAEEWSVVDNVSKGRVGISFASGWHANDFVLAPENFQQRKQIMMRDIETVRRLWRGESVALNGPFGNELKVKVLPRPVQRELPVWLTAAGNPETFQAAGEIGANLLTHLLGQSVEELSEKIQIYRDAWRKAGHAGEGYVTLMLHTFVGEDLDEVREKVRQPFTSYLKSSVGLVQQMKQGMGYDPSAQLSDADLDRVLAAAFKRYFGTSGLLGTPETCLEMVDRLKGIEVDEIGCLIDFGVDYESAMAGLKYLNQVREQSNQPITVDYSLPAQITRHGVTHLQCTPSMAKMLTLDGEARESLRPLKKLMLGGEELPSVLARELKDFITGEMHNMYGPTETTIWSATHHIENVDGRVSIGRPIANTQIYILDSQGQPVPIGVSGELYISGVGVARGYLHRPDVTAERFLPDPFSAQPGARTYRTGDLARYLANGQLEFLGRVDDQVKIRGFRIELGEVETALAQHAGVQTAVVVARQNQNNDTQLIAYVSARRESTGLTSTELLRHLREKLPEYMVPAAFVFLDELPLTPNGKVNRRALPAPDHDRPSIEEQYIAPRTATEETVAQVWREVLGVEKIGVNDSFFELGGHSLLATKLIARISEATKVKLTLSDFFEAFTVAGVAANIEQIRDSGESARVSAIKPVPHQENPPLSFAQQRLWFLMQLEPDNPSLNVPAYLRIQGKLDVGVMERSFSEIARRHEALRSTFATVRGEPVQVIVPPQPVTLELIDLRGWDQRDAEVQSLIRRECKRSFDLAAWPLFRAVLVWLRDEEHYLLLSMHHIISDAWSCEVLVNEMSALYEAFAAGKPSPLPELAVQYADFAIWQREQLQDAGIEKDLSYWRKQLAGAAPVFSLPSDRPRPEVQSHRGANHFFRLPISLAEELRTYSRQENVTLFMTLLAAFQTLLHFYTRQDDVVIAIDAANRNAVETEKLIGFFINQLVVRNKFAGKQTFRDLVRTTREVTTEAYAHQDLPFEKLVDALLSSQRSLQHAPLAQVKLSFQKSEAARQLPAGLSFSALEIDNGTAQLDLVLFLEERGDRLIGCVNYSTDLFYATTIERLLKDYEALLSAITQQPEVSLATLDEMLAEMERERQSTEARKRIEANLAKLRPVRRTPATARQEAIIEAGYLRPGQTLPRVIQPAKNGVDLVAWTRNHVEYIETELVQHGAILFRGFAIGSAERFEQFALAINADLLRENGEHQRQAISDSIYTPVSYPADKKLLWHNENSFNHEWPMKIWFHCVKPALAGGETPLVDSRKVFTQLDPAIKQRFIEKKITYVRNYIDGLGLNWQSVFRTTVKEDVEAYCRRNFMDFEWKANGGLRTRCVRPAVWTHQRSGEIVWFNQAQHWHPACLDEQTRAGLHAVYGEDDMPRNCYYGDGSLIDDSVMNEICEVYRQLEISFPWQSGDILLVDNLLTAHARNAYVGERRLFVTMGQLSSYAEELDAAALSQVTSSF